MRVILSGGGTAGHIYPALAVAGRLSADGPDDVTYVGTPDGVEARLVPEAGVRFVALPARGFDRSRPLSLLRSAWVLFGSTMRAVRMIRSISPDVVVGFGGYVCIPVGAAAVLTRTPLVLHEQNSVPGLANRLLSRWARTVAVTYESSVAFLVRPERAVVTGNPVRPSVIAADRSAGRARLRIPEDAVVLLVFGGSRGARHVNRAVADAAPTLLGDPAVHVVHVAGHSEVDDVRRRTAGLSPDASPRYHVFDYLDDMGDALAAADLVIARAGATSLAEITAVGRAAVLVPYPYATDDHQTTNAVALVEAGGAVLVRDDQLDDDAFIGTVTALLADPSARATMAAAARSLGRPDGADRVAEAIIDSVDEEAE